MREKVSIKNLDVKDYNNASATANERMAVLLWLDNTQYGAPSILMDSTKNFTYTMSLDNGVCLDGTFSNSAKAWKIQSDSNDQIVLRVGVATLSNGVLQNNYLMVAIQDKVYSHLFQINDFI